MKIEDLLSRSVSQDQGSAVLLSYLREDLKALRDEVRDLKDRSFDRFLGTAKFLLSLATFAFIAWKHVG
jgi:hypothetical protein